MNKFNVKAITLLELIITLLVFAIIAAFALPYYHNMMEQQERNKVKMILLQSLQMSRVQAQSQHSNVVICPSLNGTTCDNGQWNTSIVIFRDSDNNRKIDPNDQIIDQQLLNLKYGNLSWRGARSTPSISFNTAQGLPIGYNGSFYYCSLHSSQHLRVVLSKMGHTRTEILSTC